jgi:hypothetical protein
VRFGNSERTLSNGVLALMTLTLGIRELVAWAGVGFVVWRRNENVLYFCDVALFELRGYRVELCSLVADAC